MNKNIFLITSIVASLFLGMILGAYIENKAYSDSLKITKLDAESIKNMHDARMFGVFKRDSSCDAGLAVYEVKIDDGYVKGIDYWTPDRANGDYEIFKSVKKLSDGLYEIEAIYFADLSINNPQLIGSRRFTLKPEKSGFSIKNQKEFINKKERIDVEDGLNMESGAAHKSYYRCN
jgi:uncharacterized protein YneF (UPF0154 family)